MKKVILPLTVAVATVIALFMIPSKQEAGPTAGGKLAQTATAKAKPICASPVNPNVAAPIYCIPQQLANLPPDPGEKGKATIDGIDSDKDGLRDDLQRWIALNYPSPIEAAALTLAAKQYQRGVHYGASINKEETIPKIMRESACISALKTQEMFDDGAQPRLKELALNTEDRQRASQSYNRVFHGALFSMFEGTPDEACGFEAGHIAAMARAEGKETIASKLLAESIKRTELEEQGVAK